MVGHQFYTHLNGVPAQVVKHSPSATYISHLYNCWRRRSPSYTSPPPRHIFRRLCASGDVKTCKGRRGEDFIFALTFAIINNSSQFSSPTKRSYSLLPLTFIPHLFIQPQSCPFLFMAHSLNNVVIGILTVRVGAECLNNLNKSICTLSFLQPQ